MCHGLATAGKHELRCHLPAYVRQERPKSRQGAHPFKDVRGALHVADEGDDGHILLVGCACNAFKGSYEGV